MRPGRAPIVEGRMEAADKPWDRRWPPRRGPAEIGLVAFLTIFCWGLWVHLVLPLVGVVLWWLGIERVVGEVFTVAYDDLSQTLLAYSGVFLVIVSLFGLWVLWNVFCYSGTIRPDDKLPRVGFTEARRAFGLEPSDLDRLRRARVVHVDLDADDRVHVLALPPAAAQEPTVVGAGTE
jgi:poly-beta-1,6-N-acetyl-D-glucosamine biosynthesis protein PgaD